MVNYEACKNFLKSILSNKHLKPVTLRALTTQKGNEFQSRMSRQAKEYKKQFTLGLGITILKLCPLVQFLDISNIELTSIPTISCVIYLFCISLTIKHNLSLHTSKLSAPSLNNMAGNEN